MAGHSHFANIKHKKAANDSKKAKILSKVAKEISIAIKDGSSNPDDNPKLRLALEKARSNNIPKDNIERILSAGNKDKSTYQSITYEGYGPNGVAIIVECLTDNVNRTAAEVRSSFSKYGGNLGVSGSVSYMFDTKGIIVIDSSLASFDKVFEISMDAAVLDVKDENGVVVVETDRKDLIAAKEVFEKAGITEFLKTEISKVPNQTAELTDEQYQKLEKLIDVLEDLDDVQDVFHNAN